MTEHYTIVLDIGQTFIRCALMDQAGNILPESYSIFPSKLDQSTGVFLKNIVKIIKFNINSILHLDFDIQYIGFSLPDSMFSHQGKQMIDARELKRLLQDDPAIKAKLDCTWDFYFEKESRLFAIGEHILRKENQKYLTVLYVIIGSELSTTLLNHGKMNSERVHQDLIEVSSQRIVEISLQQGFTQGNITAKDIAEMALNHDIQAQKVYYEYGHHLGEYLNELYNQESFDEVCLGGNVALSYPLFEESLAASMESNSVRIHPTKHTFYYVIFGISEQIKNIRLKKED